MKLSCYVIYWFLSCQPLYLLHQYCCAAVLNSAQKTTERFSVPVTKAEFTVMRTACGVSLQKLIFICSSSIINWKCFTILLQKWICIFIAVGKLAEVCKMNHAVLF